MLDSKSNISKNVLLCYIHSYLFCICHSGVFPIIWLAIYCAISTTTNRQNRTEVTGGFTMMNLIDQRVYS